MPMVGVPKAAAICISPESLEIATLAAAIAKMPLRKSLPGWLKWVSLAGFCASLFSLLVSVYPFVDVVNPLGYAAKIAGTVVISNAVAVVFYKLRNQGNI